MQDSLGIKISHPSQLGRPSNYVRKAGPREGKQPAQGLTASPAKPEPRATASQGRAPGRTLGRGMTVLKGHR